MKPVPAFAAAAAVGALGLASAVSLPVRVVYNPTESAPRGFYWVTGEAPARGGFVLMYPPKSARSLIAERGYLPSDIPLIKRVVAMEGDRICRIGAAVLLNGMRVADALDADARGRAMPVWSGCFTLEDGQMFVLQDHPQSFDGRYFGPTELRHVIGRAHRLNPSKRGEERR